MRQTLVTIQRPENTNLVVGGVTAQHIRIQVDQVSDYLRATMVAAQEWIAGDYYRVITEGWYGPNFLIQRHDALIDELLTDPEHSATSYKLKVVGKPKDYWYDHQECYCLVVVGS